LIEQVVFDLGLELTSEKYIIHASFYSV